MVGNPFILVEFPEDDPLGNYFNLKDFENDFIPKDTSVPLVDQIKHRVEGKKDVLIMLSANRQGALARLFEEKSIYNNFREMVSTGRIKVIITVI